MNPKHQRLKSYKTKPDQVDITDSALKIIKRAICKNGLMNFCFMHNLNYFTISKKINKSIRENGKPHPIFKKDIELWYKKLTKKKFKWGNNLLITQKDKNLELLK